MIHSHVHITRDTFKTNVHSFLFFFSILQGDSLNSASSKIQILWRLEDFTQRSAAFLSLFFLNFISFLFCWKYCFKKYILVFFSDVTESLMEAISHFFLWVSQKLYSGSSLNPKCFLRAMYVRQLSVLCRSQDVYDRTRVRLIVSSSRHAHLGGWMGGINVWWGESVTLTSGHAHTQISMGVATSMRLPGELLSRGIRS